MKFFIKTFGCQMNEHDSLRMRAILEETGMAAAARPEEAQVILLNTCSVRHNPENKVYSMLGVLRERKRHEPNLIVGVAGCVAQQDGRRMLEREKALDLVFGPDQYFRLPELLARVQEGERVCETQWAPRTDKVQNFIPDEWLEHNRLEGIRASIAITKGCNNHCSFCIVPQTRGREVSREADNILREAESLREAGAKEIWLLGQNVNSYRSGENTGFYELLDLLSRELPGIRLRFTSPHPKDWNDRLSDLMGSRKNICKQLHLPFQAGSDRILKAMRRHHTLEEYLAKVSYLKQAAPGVELSTDLIVGYPTETEEDFAQTLFALEQVGFGQVFSFKYSPRPGTKAAELPDDVPRPVKEERLARVIALQAQINEQQLRGYVGTVQETLIDGVHPTLRHVMNGRTDGYRPISVHHRAVEIGQTVQLTVTGYSGHWLEGVLTESKEN